MFKPLIHISPIQLTAMAWSPSSIPVAATPRSLSRTLTSRLSVVLLLSVTLLFSVGCDQQQAVDAEAKASPDSSSDNRPDNNTDSSPNSAALATGGADDLAINAVNKVNEHNESSQIHPQADSPPVPQDAPVTGAPRLAKDDLGATAAQSSAESKQALAQPSLEKQVTKVTYQNASGHTLQVTYQTSGMDTLVAELLLASGKRLLLSAPKGQGNNPTYRSQAGNIELVTHGGGGSIELLSNGNSSSFDAVSAEAEVVSPP